MRWRTWCAAFATSRSRTPKGSIDAARDAATMETELILADHTIAERRIEKLELAVKKTNRTRTRRSWRRFASASPRSRRRVPLRNLEFSDEE